MRDDVNRIGAGSPCPIASVPGAVSITKETREGTGPRPLSVFKPMRSAPSFVAWYVPFTTPTSGSERQFGGGHSGCTAFGATRSLFGIRNVAPGAKNDVSGVETTMTKLFNVPLISQRPFWQPAFAGP